MDLIFYWKKSYFANEYHQTLKDLKLYTNYPPNGISVGDTMWVVTKNEDVYVLVGKFIIEQTKREPSVNGDFCIIGDKNKSFFYDINSLKQKTFKSVLQKIKPGWINDEIGVYFRGKKHIQELTETSAHRDLEKFSKTLGII